MKNHMIGGRERPLLSICITTFNRGQQVFELVQNILKCDSNRIEVVVVDNYSSDNTRVLLNSIQDYRFVFRKNSKNIGAFKNGLKALYFARGIYSLACLDKDFIHGYNINNLIKKIENDDEIIFGRCSLNIEKEEKDILFDKGVTSVYNMAYLSDHPTGKFYKTDVLKKLKIIKNYYNSNMFFGFPLDVIDAEMSLLGKSKKINLPVFYYKTIQVDTKTYTYLDKQTEFFFYPPKDIESF